MDDDDSKQSEEAEFMGDNLASNPSKTSNDSATVPPPPAEVPKILNVLTQPSNNNSKLPPSTSPIVGGAVSASPGTANTSGSPAGNTADSSSSKSSDISSTASSRGGMAAADKQNKYAAIRASIKTHKSPKSARKQRKVKIKKLFPPPGNGKVNRLYTFGTQDSSNIAIVMHKKNAGEGAFTKTVDDQICKNPELKEAMGINNLCFRVDPDDGSKPYAVDYTNKFKEKKVKYTSVYQHKSSNTTKPKREKWGGNLIKFFNRHGSAKYAPNDWGEEKFEYGGDIDDEDDPYFLADFFTNADVAHVMKTDFAYSAQPLTCTQLTERRDVVELYFGPGKIDDGVSALLAKQNPGINIPGEDDDDDDDPVPFDSDDEA